MPSPYEQRTQKLQELVTSQSYSLSDTPGYAQGVKGNTHGVSYQELYPLVWGRECGSAGIGRLREVAISAVNEHEFAEVFRQDPDFFHAFSDYASLDWMRLRDQSDQYQALLEDNGVLVHRIDFPDPPVSAFGPMMYMWAARELLILRGGSVVPKMGWNPYSVGRGEYLAMWALQNLSVPILHTIVGDVVCEPGPCLFLAEDVFVSARSIAFSDGGLRQLHNLVELTQEGIDMTFLTLTAGGNHLYFDRNSGGSGHPDMLIGPLDVDKVLLYPGGIDFATWEWLRERGYTIIEVDHDEHVQFVPANLVTLEPGRVMMHAEAKKAIASVRRAGVEVIEVPFSEYFKAGGGLHCATMDVLRDRGPLSTDR